MCVSELYKLFRRNVPHILEKIFFSLDYNTFKKCHDVSKDWKNLLISETFLERGKTIFCEQIRYDLMLSTKEGNIDMIIKLLSSFRVDVNFISENDMNLSPLALAALKGHDEVIELLLDKGAEPNVALPGWQAEKEGCTALHIASHWGHKNVAKLLLQGGAEPNIADGVGATPLFDAATEGHKDLVQLLLYNGAELNMTSTEPLGITPLHCAVSKGHKDVVAEQ